MVKCISCLVVNKLDCSFEEGHKFDAVVLDDDVFPHPKKLHFAERMQRAVYLGLDEKISPLSLWGQTNYMERSIDNA